MNYEVSSGYRIQPKENWRFVAFLKNQVEVDGVMYWFSEFVNSGKFKIHDVIIMNVGGDSAVGTVFHVWYEKHV